jgi:ferritin-like metal-binding protein YciE
MGMHIKKFRDMYLAELQELRSAEMQLGVTLRHMAEAATNSRLADALMRHCREAKLQKERLDSLLQRHGSSPRHTDKAMQVLIIEAQRMALLLSSNVLRDAGLIASVQKLEHYEIAAYGAAAASAGQLGLREDQKILHQSLDEKRRLDVELTQIAKDEVNPEAAAADEANEAEEEEKAEEEGEPKAEVEKA